MSAATVAPARAAAAHAAGAHAAGAVSVRPLPHTFWCQTRWGDQDPNGHVNNTKVVQYIQEAIFDLLRADGCRLFDGGFMIVRHEVDFRSQLLHQDENRGLPVQIWVEAVGNRSYTVRVESRRRGVTVFEARTVCVARDAHTHSSRVLLPAERDHLLRYRLAEPTTVGLRRHAAPPAPRRRGGLRRLLTRFLGGPACAGCSTPRR